MPENLKLLEYDFEAIQLYWYASTLFEMPILQFFVYYQVLEYYFPFYATKEVQNEISNIVKDMRFDPDSTNSIAKIISSVQGKLGRGYGEERAQLRMTISGITQSNELRMLLEKNDIKDYLIGSYKKISQQKINIENKDLDLRDQVAERIYDIRCRIVHTKADDREQYRIAPFSEEESLLTSEVKIIEFLARKAIIANGKKLNLN